MDAAPIEKGGLRAYTILGTGLRTFSIVQKETSYAVYAASIEPTIDMLHPNSITLYSHASSDRVVGAVRIYPGRDTIEVVLGDPEDFSGRENRFWEEMHARHHEPRATTFEFALDLGDDMRRDFEWHMAEQHLGPTGNIAMPSKRSHSWVKSLERVLLWGPRAKPVEKPDAYVENRYWNLVDRDAGETVATVIPREHRDGESVDGDRRERQEIGRVIIYRDFWERGRYEEKWDRMVLLTCLAVLKSQVEQAFDD